MPTDELITIRPFEPGDEQVCKWLFVKGIEYVRWPTFKQVLKSYTALAVDTLVLLILLIWPNLLMFILPFVCLLLLALWLLIKREVYEYCQHSIDSDLANIQQFYMNTKDRRSHYWVAILNNSSRTIDGLRSGDIVGMIALEYKDNDNGELRRMSVHPQLRRLRVGMKLIGVLLDWAKAKGYKRIYLQTTIMQKPAIAMYRNAGFKYCQNGSRYDWKSNIAFFMFEKTIE
ncbi:unnamed protein product [Didymodactylos carnosus]|uniref:N-acetyltransferase domain-containing protein n=1 Tax=Didymodactylos carnosus TaxID=1234261 RepID=A0A814ULN3_9BILA|nr:unnamed protein product [Didymodactylos carnosus]CAF1176470.1 unnamed protein product [Didymodactylos carnosus]CAF3614526.1 unnamed protein product [Didymodactylos carnosus]CAF3940500.1 unnamed protein product [Didymodactylos carnosus]